MLICLVFADMWQALTQDVSTVCKEIMEKQIPEKQTYMSLPRPGVSQRTCMRVFHKSFFLDS